MAGFPLPASADVEGYRVIGFDTVGSTNTEAANAAMAGDSGKLWFAALQQTAGKGRRGRPWESPYGNLAASLLITPDGETESFASLGFVAGVALNCALEKLIPNARIASGIDGADGRSEGASARIALKWPNDVLADGAKLAGILLEGHKRPDGRQAIVIGFGINVVAAPEGLPYPAIALRDLGIAVDAATVFEALAESWVACFKVWDNGRGIAEILDAWRAAAAGIGAEVAVQRNRDVVRGVFETIDDAGRLIVRDPEGHRIAIAAGDVHFGTTATLKL
ncbi:biotin--[acetyl-CoA-carboxylase] ligase [Pelagibacterium halotolerans]|uniref:biotin--[acetyl-CoA-carboxylase] ligase n=1 Tax=Pelagibacterium halotolerans TaxID=531813 RepID=UPI00384B9710